jgi:hypothetical protein
MIGGALKFNDLMGLHLKALLRPGQSSRNDRMKLLHCSARGSVKSAIWHSNYAMNCIFSFLITAATQNCTFDSRLPKRTRDRRNNEKARKLEFTSGMLRTRHPCCSQEPIPAVRKMLGLFGGEAIELGSIRD